MALYKTHTRFNILFALPLLILALIHFLHPHIHYVLTFSLTFAIATFFMNPDVDIANEIKLFSIRGVLTMPFRPYSMIFHHRGISHSMIFGTLTRILYLGVLTTIVLFICNHTFLEKINLFDLFRMYKYYFIFGFVGIFLADLCHLLLDLRFAKKVV